MEVKKDGDPDTLNGSVSGLHRFSELSRNISNLCDKNFEFDLVDTSPQNPNCQDEVVPSFDAERGVSPRHDAVPLP